MTGFAAPTQAEIATTAQANAADAAWLAYAPPPPTPAGICLVDSGVNLNTDTQPIVTRRLALDGGTPDDVDSIDHHGTLMAMIAAAPANGTGMIGAAPNATRIISIRASPTPTGGNDVTFPYSYFETAIRQCSKYRVSDNVRVVELALGSSEPASTDEAVQLEDEVAFAHEQGLDIVAATGNTSGAVQAPANVPDVLGVGAADAAGVLCGFTSRGAGLDLLAPGCGIDTVDPVSLGAEDDQGTSQASAFAAGVLAALRAYRPDLTWEDAEGFLTRAASNGVLDAGAAFRLAGLTDIVDAGHTATPRSPASTAAGSAVPAVDRVRRWGLPRMLFARFRHGVLSVAVRALPRDALLHAVAQRRTGGQWLTLASRSAHDAVLRIRTRRRPGRIVITFRDATGQGRDSLARYLFRLAT